MAKIAKTKFTVPSLTSFVNLAHVGFCLELINTTEVFNGLHRFFDYFSPILLQTLSVLKNFTV